MRKCSSDDEWEAEYQEAVAMMTVARQRRAEVNRARQFFREPQSFEGRKAQLDKLKQKLPCARCGQLGHWKDDNDCPAKVKVLNWRKPRSFQFLQSLATSLSREREQGATTSTLSSTRGGEALTLDEGVCHTRNRGGSQGDCSSKLVGELCTVSCVSGAATLCHRSSCVSPTRVFCTSSGLKTSRALRMCALMYRTWTTPL